MKEVVWRSDRSEWAVGYHVLANIDGKFLSEIQHDQLVLHFLEMANYEDPIGVKLGKVERIYDYYELKEKGGVFGKLNVRVYFTVEAKFRAIVVLACCKKEIEGQIKRHMKRRIESRLNTVRAELSKYGVAK